MRPHNYSPGVGGIWDDLTSWVSGTVVNPALDTAKNILPSASDITGGVKTAVQAKTQAEIYKALGVTSPGGNASAGVPAGSGNLPGTQPPMQTDAGGVSPMLILGVVGVVGLILLARKG